MGSNFVFGCVLVFSFFVPTIENGEGLSIQVLLFRPDVFVFFLFVFHAKLATTINHRTGLSDISY